MSPSQTPDRVTTHLRHVAVGIDDDFVLPLLTLAFSSLPKGSEKEWNLFFFEGRLAKENREVIQSVFDHFGISLNFHVGLEDDKFDSRRHLSSSTFLKFQAFEKLGPATIWLDSDLLLLSDWMDIEAHLDENFPLQAISDDTADRQQFNAGVMVLNHPLNPRWMQLIREAPAERYSSDQVIFNTMYLNSYGKMPEKFNTLWGKLVDGDVQAKPSVIHYGGANKPWHLPDDLIRFCCSDDCVWRPYLLTQSGMLASLPSPIQDYLRTLGRLKRRKRLPFYRREALGRHFSYLLEITWPLNLPIVKILRLFSGIFPQQALHPIHARRNVWNWASRANLEEVN